MMMSFDRVADIYDETRRMPPEVAKRIMERIASYLSNVSDAEMKTSWND